MSLEIASVYLKKLKIKPAAGSGYLAQFLSNFRVTFLIILSITVYGAFGYINLPRRVNPEVKIPIVFVSTIYPGANPIDIESLVTIPIENAVAGVANITQVS